MKQYVLSEEDIRNILEKGKFNKDEYAEKLTVGYWLAGDIVDTYEQSLMDEDLEKWEKIYEENKVKILEKISEDFSLDDHGCEYIEEDMQDQFVDLALDVITGKEVL